MGSIGAYVVSMNLHRRHLTDSQRAMIAANLATLKVGDNQHTAQAVSQGEAAKTLSVSVDSLQRGKKVRESNHPRLIEAVERGVIDVSNAFVLATLDQAELDVLTSTSDPKDMVRKARAIKKLQKEDHARFLMEGRGSSTNHGFDDGHLLAVFLDVLFQCFEFDRAHAGEDGGSVVNLILLVCETLKINCGVIVLVAHNVLLGVSR
ncbi:hypothetical protein [Paraburkholderia domus]|uniref:Uncharacterized protein n=1 Tax=Paraburkholderia domus TaxID=2793075 RepID=A0A9N8QT12_9BURK|nr:hypothetical protein [Paraburkholderia domus]MBK5164823.1 hypothetical protein [Burkholderia sp. R-70211]CAE6872333.1 hypothetical protein R70211_01350 [Paraburkholderia domus]